MPQKTPIGRIEIVGIIMISAGILILVFLLGQQLLQETFNNKVDEISGLSSSQPSPGL